ncbi:glycosyltransferase [Halorubrum sp. T3]|uniref:glycosyltransferase n=1 Tax=Halorubrum sp. T3 TaxID=1194088 RepID=UPI0009E34840|nr:glycosyltransferase [Halorubrum sp. T3]
MTKRVITLPYDDDTNTYRRELLSALEEVDGIDPVQGSWWPAAPILGAALFSDERPDIIHLHWIHLFFYGDSSFESVLKFIRFPFELLIVRLLGIKLVWTVHNLREHDRRAPRAELFQRRIAARLCSRLITHCDRAASLVREEYQIPSKCSNRVSVVPHGNYINAYQNDISESDARKKLGIDSEEFVYLYFGQIREYKQVPKIIKCFTDIESKNSRLLIAGNPKTKKLKRCINESASKSSNIDVVLKFVPDDEIQIYMNAADVVVLPYRDILTSGTAILAMSFSLPVVVPQIGCMPELLAQQSELLYEQDDRESFRKKLNAAKSSNLTSIGEKNLAEMEKSSWDRVAEETCDIYLSL